MPGSEVRALDIPVYSRAQDLLEKARLREGMRSGAWLNC